MKSLASRGQPVVLAGITLLLSACPSSSALSAQGGRATVEAYRDALRRDDLTAAYALTDPAHRRAVSFADYQASLASAKAREAKIDTLEAALAGLTQAAPELTPGAGGRDSSVPTHERADEVLSRFLDAVDRGDFRAAYTLLAGKWRARYTPERFAAEFGREPGAKDRLSRARAALSRGARARGEETLFPIGEGRAVVLRREDDGYRVAALE